MTAAVTKESAPSARVEIEPARERRPMPSAGRHILPVLMWSALFVLLLAYARSFRHTYIDDTFITLQYARNLAEHGTWGFLPDRAANTATSPLNVILLALADRLLPGSTVDGVAWVTAAVWALLLALLLRISRCLLAAPHFGLFATALLATNPLLLSTIGLESYLFALLMVAAVACFLERRPALLGAVLGLLVLARPDGVLFLLIVLLLVPIGLRGRARVALVAGATMLPWYLYSWVRLGSFVPDTLVIKLEQGAWGATTFADGLDLYRDRYELATLASLWPVVLVPFALVPLARMERSGQLAFAALGVYGVVHYLAYAALAVPPYHWYYVHQVVPIALFGALGGASLLHGAAASPVRLERAAALAATLLPVAVVAYLADADGWRLRQAPIHSNWATPGHYQSIGIGLRDAIQPDTVVELRGEIGTVAYYCECRLVDDFADLNRTTEAMKEIEAEASEPVASLLRVNLLWREDEPPLPPAGYVLDYDPIDAGETPSAPGQEMVVGWDVASRWIPATRILLRTLGHLTIDVRVAGADGWVLPPEQQPELSGTFRVAGVAGGGPLAGIAEGEWTHNRVEGIPVLAHSTVVVQVNHPAYHGAELTAGVGSDPVELVVLLTPRTT